MAAAQNNADGKVVEIDFLFLDLERCTRCKGTDANLEAALDTVRSVLAATGALVSLRKTLVGTEQQAMELGFISSPTIRVNGKDIALELKESRCDTCADACGCDGKIDCRVWIWRGQEYTEAPGPLIVDAILSAVYGTSGQRAPERGSSRQTGGIPENLKLFFASKTARQVSICCEPAEQAECCAPSEKAACCGADASKSQAAGCGCQ